MQKPQNVASRDFSPGVHLRRAPTRRRDDAIGKWLGGRQSRIGTSTIDYDDLESGPKRSEIPQKAADQPGLIQNRDNDGKKCRPLFHQPVPTLREGRFLRWKKIQFPFRAKPFSRAGESMRSKTRRNAVRSTGFAKNMSKPASFPRFWSAAVK